MASTSPQPLTFGNPPVAIIGAGVAGITLALGLARRGVPFTIYEERPDFEGPKPGVYAGVVFSPNAERAMELLHPDMLPTYKRIANKNYDRDYVEFVDGRHRTSTVLNELTLQKDAFQDCLRSNIVREWASLLPPNSIHFNKRLETITESRVADSKITLLWFQDGTRHLAHAVVGCDGIGSRVRDIISSPPLIPYTPALPYPSPTGRYCIRLLVDMNEAIRALGEHAAMSRRVYTGPGHHIITLPVAYDGDPRFHILFVLSGSPGTPIGPGESGFRHGCQVALGYKKRAEVLALFRDWEAPAVKGIVGFLARQHLPPTSEGADDGEHFITWALYDMGPDQDTRCPFYARGGVCIAGDAAHAIGGPHLGACGAMAVEDALVLAELLRATNNNNTGATVEHALAAYNEVRYERTQEVMKATREACDLYSWKGGFNPGDFFHRTRFACEVQRLLPGVWRCDPAWLVEQAKMMLKIDPKLFRL
jgi:salicylate hydroxylase